MTPEERVLAMFRDMGRFYLACKEGDLETVKLYLEKPDFNPTAHDLFAFQHAVEHNKIEVVRLLMIDPRFDPSANNNQALTTTVNGNPNVYLFQIRKLLLHDERVITGNSDLKTTAMIDRHIKNRNRRRFALIFVGKTIGQGWADIVTYAQNKLDF